VHALADRCAHRHAPLSLGRVENDSLRCRYHGLVFDASGRCTEVPGAAQIPPACRIRAYPAAVRDGWVWIWMGDAAAADPALIPAGVGFDAAPTAFRSGALDYDADYRLINDNLCDLSHLDFLHETTLGAASGGGWVDTRPRVTVLDRGIRVERWRPGRPANVSSAEPVDMWNGYSFLVPGIFVMDTRVFPLGEAARCGGEAPTAAPTMRWLEQQAVTPTCGAKARYFFASGAPDCAAALPLLDRRFAVLQAAFAEDRLMIEGQQSVAAADAAPEPPVFLPQDRAPMLMRRVLDRLIALERGAMEPPRN
jgi:vanillate O-demethylase monooxygenase subunit